MIAFHDSFHQRVSTKRTVLIATMKRSSCGYFEFAEEVSRQIVSCKQFVASSCRFDIGKALVTEEALSLPHEQTLFFEHIALLHMSLLRKARAWRRAMRSTGTVRVGVLPSLHRWWSNPQIIHFGAIG